MEERSDDHGEDPDEYQPGKQGVERSEHFRRIAVKRIDRAHPPKNHRGIQQRVDPLQTADVVVTGDSREQRPGNRSHRHTDVREHTAGELKTRERALRSMFIHLPSAAHAHRRVKSG